MFRLTTTFSIRGWIVVLFSPLLSHCFFRQLCCTSGILFYFLFIVTNWRRQRKLRSLLATCTLSFHQLTRASHISCFSLFDFNDFTLDTNVFTSDYDCVTFLCFQGFSNFAVSNYSGCRKPEYVTWTWVFWMSNFNEHLCPVMKCNLHSA